MTVSVFDLFTVGIGPSSSHTVGPMRAAGRFVTALSDAGVLPRVNRVRAELFGSLGATGHGHGSVKAVVLGLTGEAPESVDPHAAEPVVAAVRESGGLALNGQQEIGFSIADDIILHRRKRLPFHPNGMQFHAFGKAGDMIASRAYYSIGGGFVLAGSADGEPEIVADDTPVPFPFSTGAELLGHTRATGLPISGVMLENEKARRTEAEVRGQLLHIWSVMRACVEHGCAAEGVLPGGLKVRRRAHALHRALVGRGESSDPLRAIEWVALFALAVNKENASGGRVVTAPTNGAAGIVPAVLHYYDRFVEGADDDGIVRFAGPGQRRKGRGRCGPVAADRVPPRPPRSTAPARAIAAQP